MLCRGRCPVALAFVLLLAGQEVAVVSALRETSDLGEWELKAGAAPEARPDSDKGCKMEGTIGSGVCTPTKYCEYERVWTLSRDKTCRLKVPYWEDARLVAKFGTASGSLLGTSEAFRGSWNSATALKRLWNLRTDIKELGSCDLALDTPVPDKKPMTRKCKEAFAEKDISEYYVHLSSLKAKGVKDLDLFDTDDFDEAARKMKAFDRALENIEVGSKKHTLLSKMFAQVNVTALVRMQAGVQGEKVPTSGGEELPTPEELKTIFPTAGDEMLKKAIADTMEKKKKIETKCQGQANPEGCVGEEVDEEKGETFGKLEKVVDEEEEEQHELLLQRLESHGHVVRANEGEGKDATRISLLEFLDDHLDKLALSEEEADKLVMESVEKWILAVVAIIIIAILGVFCLAVWWCWMIILIVGGWYLCQKGEHCRNKNNHW